MANSDCILKVDKVSKEYRLGVIGRTTLRAELQSRMARFRGEDDPNIRIDGRSLPPGTFRAVDDVSFEASRGERIALIGKNGAGKSTLLKLICRVTAPTEGTISYNGRVTSMLEVGTGFHPELTGRENIFLNGSILGMRRSEIHRRFDEIVEFSEVGKYIDTPVKRYSSGMFVRLAFSISAYLNADIVIMDEVLAVGDIDFQQKCISRMREIAENEGRTIIYVSHNMDTVLALCDRSLVLEEGRLIFDGNIDEGVELYRGSAYIGTTRDYSSEHDHTQKGHNSRVASMVSAACLSDQAHVSDELSLKLAWDNALSLPNLGLRITVYDNLGSLIGSKVFFNIDRDYPDGLFTIDTSNLQNGHYRTTYDLFSINALGYASSVDHVDGLSFTISDPSRSPVIHWDSRHWGAVEFG